MFQSEGDTVFARFFCDKGHPVKKRSRVCISHRNTVREIGEHRKIIVAVSECIGILFWQIVMIKDKLDSGCFAVAVRDKFPECAAPVNAVEMYVADLSESLQLLFVLKPDNKFITGKIRWLQIRWHCITAFHESVILCHGIRMNDRTDRIISNRSGWFENNVHIGVSCCF